MQELNFEGVVWVPEWTRFDAAVPFDQQVEWEHTGLNHVSVIAFWVPREMKTMPALTTNVEFGRFIGVRPCVYGRPEGAPHTQYLDWLYYKNTAKRPQSTLRDTMREAVEFVDIIRRTKEWRIANGVPLDM